MSFHLRSQRRSTSPRSRPSGARSSTRSSTVVVLDDISRLDDDALLGRRSPPLVQVVLFLFRQAHARRGIFSRLDTLARHLIEVACAPHGKDAIAAILVYLQNITRRTEQQVHMAIQHSLGDSVYESILHAGERMRAEASKKGRMEGLRDGLREGLQEGLREGLQKGLRRQRDMLLRQLTLRFGELPRQAIELVQGADAELLDQIADRVVSTSTLEEALGQASNRARQQPRTKAQKRRPPAR